MDREVSQSSVIQLVLQFLRENGFSDSAAELQRESAVVLNAVPDLDQLSEAVMKGDWSAVIATLTRHSCNMPESFWFDLYSQIVLDLSREGDYQLALSMLSKSEVLRRMCAMNPDRWMLLKSQLTQHSKKHSSSDSELRRQSVHQRARLVTALKQHVRQVEPGRLLSLLSQAAQFRSLTQVLKPGDTWDLLASDSSLLKSAQQRILTLEGDTKMIKKVDKVPSKNVWCVRFDSSEHRPSVAAFSSDGTTAVTGDSSGLLQFWDVIGGTSVQSIKVDSAVRDVCFTEDSRFLAVCEANGSLSMWNVRSGEKSCELAQSGSHSEGLSCVRLDQKCSRCVTCSLDGSLQLFGLRSRSQLATLKGHSSFVNDLRLFAEDKFIVSVSADSSLRIWDLSLQKCVSRINFASMLSSLENESDPGSSTMKATAKTGNASAAATTAGFSTSASLQRVLVLDDPNSSPTIGDARLYFDSHTGTERSSDKDGSLSTDSSTLVRLIVQCDSPHIFVVDFDCESCELCVCPELSSKLTLRHSKAKSGNVVTELPLYMDACLSANHRLLFALDSTGVCRAFDTRNGKLKGALRTHDHPQSTLGMVCSPVNSSLLTFAKDNTLKLWA